MNPNNPFSTMLFGIRLWFRLLMRKAPQNVGPVEEPFNHIVAGGEMFGPEVDGLVRELAAHPSFERVRQSVIDMLWGNSPQFGTIIRSHEFCPLLEKFRRKLDQP